MSSIDDGGQAFPCAGGGEWPGNGGMSIRDYFAGQAIPQAVAIAQEQAEKMFMRGEVRGVDFAATLASSIAYAVADAMLAARKEVPNG